MTRNSATIFRQSQWFTTFLLPPVEILLERNPIATIPCSTSLRHIGHGNDVSYLTNFILESMTSFSMPLFTSESNLNCRLKEMLVNLNG